VGGLHGEGFRCLTGKPLVTICFFKVWPS